MVYYFYHAFRAGRGSTFASNWFVQTLGQAHQRCTASVLFLSGGAIATGVAATTSGPKSDSGNKCMMRWWNHDYSGTTTSTTTTHCEAAVASKIPKADLQKRMTAIGRFSLVSETVFNPSIITVLVTLKGKPFGVQDFAQQWQEKNMASRHPRFTWKAHETVDGHFDATPFPQSRGASSSSLPVTEGLPLTPGRERQDLQARIANLQMKSWDLTQSLWNVQIIPCLVRQTWVDKLPNAVDDDPTKQSTTTPVSANIVPKSKYVPSSSLSSSMSSRSMILWQSHHVLADGVSLGAALLDLSDEAQEIRDMVHSEVQKRKAKAKKRTFWQRFIYRLSLLAWFVLGSLRALVYQVQLWFWSTVEPNPWRTLRQGADPAEPQRTISFTTAGSVDQAKWVAQTLGGGKQTSKITINDVFVAAVTGALARQLQYHRERLRAQQATAEQNEEDTTDDDSSKLLAVQKHMNVVVPVHLKGGVLLPNESAGNNIGAFCAVVPGEDGNMAPAERLQRVHSSLRVIKQSPVAFLSHGIASVVSRFLPVSWASYLYSAVNAGATVVVTNVKGPGKTVHYQGRIVESLFGFIPIPPGIPVGVTVNSYSGQVSLSLTAESWAVPDGDQFLAWVLEEYKALMQSAREL